ncbi:MAG: hypothetical protein ACK2UE_19680 [Anaerolineales bacterium]
MKTIQGLRESRLIFSKAVLIERPALGISPKLIILQITMWISPSQLKDD